MLNPTWGAQCRHGGDTFCHSRARCVDHAGGSCCRCNPGHFGDGRNCLADGAPQRINGIVGGEVNTVDFSGQDLHCYVVTEDGRTYTAISRVPESIGTAMQSLTAVGSPIAWLFAQPVGGGGSKNGFELSGGVFNYTATIRYPQSGHSATIKFQFKGMDAFDYLKGWLEVN